MKVKKEWTISTLLIPIHKSIGFCFQLITGKIGCSQDYNFRVIKLVLYLRNK